MEGDVVSKTLPWKTRRRKREINLANLQARKTKRSDTTLSDPAGFFSLFGNASDDIENAPVIPFNELSASGHVPTTSRLGMSLQGENNLLLLGDSNELLDDNSESSSSSMLLPSSFNNEPIDDSSDESSASSTFSSDSSSSLSSDCSGSSGQSSASSSSSDDSRSSLSSASSGSSDLTHGDELSIFDLDPDLVCQEGLEMEVVCANCDRSGDGFILEEDAQPGSELEAYVNLQCKIVHSDEITSSSRCSYSWISAARLRQCETFQLCWQCFNLLCVSGAREKRKELYGWPSFIKSLLVVAAGGKDPAVTPVKIWGMLPRQYRRWWFSSLAQWSEAFAGCCLDMPPCLISDVSQAKHRCDSSMRKLRAVELFSDFDKYMALPQVRCPYGCSEFLNRCNGLSLDQTFFRVLQTSNTKIVRLSPMKKKGFLEGIRSDYLVGSHNILHIPSWPCRPRLCFDIRHGPQILCCRYHSERTQGRYIHVPRPLGCTFTTPCDNQFAPAIAKPRTVGYGCRTYSKNGKFTNSFQTCVGEGRFDGFDTLFLSDIGSFDRSNVLSAIRDSIALKCRPDVRSHFQFLVEHDYVPVWFRDQVLRHADEIMVPSVMNQLMHSDRGGTYIQMDDAILMQKCLKEETEHSVADKDGRIIWFRPPWPSVVPSVHADDGFGAPFPPIPYYRKKKDDGMEHYQIVWLLLGLLTSSKELWLDVCYSVSEVEDWKGWMLLYATSRCYPSVVCKGSRSNPFKTCLSNEQIHQRIMGSVERNATDDYDLSVLHWLFQDVSNVKVLELHEDFSELTDTEHVQESTNVVLVTNCLKLGKTEDIHFWSGDWELVAAAATSPCGTDENSFRGKIYSRHCGNSDGWWSRSHQSSVHSREAVQCRIDSGNAYLFDFGEGCHWDVLMYVRKSTSSTDFNMKVDYMKCCGFQTEIRCKKHLIPLTVWHSAMELQEEDMAAGAFGCCMECESASSYYCSVPSCTVKLCKSHMKVLTSVSGTSHDNPVFVSDVRTTESSPDSSVLDYCTRGNGILLRDETMDDGNQTMVSQQEIHDALLQNLPMDLITANNNESLDQDDNEDMPYANVVPTTQSSKGAVTFYPERHVVGAHVVFNKHARLLVRRKRKLIASKRQNHWLQKIVARTNTGSWAHPSVNRTLPLLYPEGTIFPNIFYKAISDGSLVGAMPTAVLADNTTVKKWGLAPLHDHIRTRVLDTSLLCSNDHTYMLYGLDACLNLGVRGHDIRVQLQRAWDPDMTKGDGIRCSLNNLEDEANKMWRTEEQVDNSVMCDKVAAAMNREMPALFWTYTMNMKSAFGVRVIKRKLDDERTVRYIAKRVFKNHSAEIPVKHWATQDYDCLRQQLLDSSAILSMRMYENMWEVFRHYLIHSSEKPLGGTVSGLVDRTELQAKVGAGNLPHHHIAIWLKENDGTEAGKRKIIDHIRGCINSIAGSDEIDKLIEDGVVSSLHDLLSRLQDLESFLQHRCTTKCLRQTGQKSVGTASFAADGDPTFDELLEQGYRCKVPNNHRLSETPNQHTFRKIERPHCEQAKIILRELGLLFQTWNEEKRTYEEVLDERLYAVQHIPPATAEHGTTSPVLARLALLMPGNQNVQFLDSVLAARYLTKYIIMVDESNRLYVRPPSEEKHSDYMTAGGENTPNTKATSVLADERKRQSKSKKNYVARIVGSPESVMLLLNFPQVYSTFNYMHIVTSPLGERPGLDRLDKRQWLVNQGNLLSFPEQLSDVDASRLVISQFVRRDWFERHFNEHALVLAKDQCFSNITMDSVTKFGLRPPELYWVRHQKIYFECFHSAPITRPKKLSNSESDFDASVRLCKELLDENNLDQCAWVDASFDRVLVRRAALPKLISYVDNLLDSDFRDMNTNRPREKVRGLLCSLRRNYERSISVTGFRTVEAEATWISQSKRFLFALKNNDTPVPWFRRVSPNLGNRFLYHLLLAMGKFTTEMEISLCASFQQAFVKVGLIDSNNMEESLKELLKKYVLEYMPAHAGGTKTFDEDLIQMHRVARGGILFHRIVPSGMPPVLFTRLCELRTQEAAKYIREWQETTVRFVLNELQQSQIEMQGNIPSLEELCDRSHQAPDTRNCLWPVDSLRKSSEQSLDSFEEQSFVLQRAQDTLHELIHSSHQSHAKSLCIVGGPGVGKTTLTTLVVLHALSIGLRCACTALGSDRAQQIGGKHLHVMFKLPIEDETKMTAGKMADVALASLYGSGQVEIAFLRWIDILFVDEMGQLPCHYISVLDIILRKIRKSNLFMGGVLIIATMDIFQLLPINALPPLLSPHMMTSFRFFELRHSVRAAQDPLLRELQDLTRTMPSDFTQEKKDRFLFLVRTLCTFVDSFDDPRIPKNAVFVFGKNEPGRILRDKKLRSYERDPANLFCVAVDEESTNNGQWKEATEHITCQLNKKTKEDQKIFFVRGMVYQITKVKKNRYHNHQICMLWDVPSRETVAAMQPVMMMVAPPGERDIPPFTSLSAKQDLFERGWKEMAVGVSANKTVYSCVGNVKARRKQYSLKLYITATLHSAMGCTFPGLCSKVSNSSDSPYYIWERAMVIVLLSRTKLGAHICFVGDADSTAKALLQVMLRETQYFRYMMSLMEVLLAKNSTTENTYETPPIATLNEHPFRSLDVPLPSDTSGFVYLLVSLTCNEVTYIGETHNIGNRLNEHNSGIGGAMQTSSLHLRPWALLCFVVGFEYDKAARKAFETKWQRRREHLRRQSGKNPEPMDLVDLAGSLVLEANQETSRTLRLVVTGKIEHPLN